VEAVEEPFFSIDNAIIAWSFLARKVVAVSHVWSKTKLPTMMNNLRASCIVSESDLCESQNKTDAHEVL
jgi:hypothetical protein